MSCLIWGIAIVSRKPEHICIIIVISVFFRFFVFYWLYRYHYFLTNNYLFVYNPALNLQRLYDSIKNSNIMVLKILIIYGITRF